MPARTVRSVFAAYRRLVAARREPLEKLLGDWTPERHDELAATISRLARDLVAEDARPAR